MSDNKEPFNIKNIQDNFNEQQAKILALREVVRKTESENKVVASNAQEKIRNIAQCLTNIKSKAKQRQSLGRSVSSEVISISEEDEKALKMNIDMHQPISRKSETKEKFQLLREQLEKNKLKIAERESNKKGIEEMVVKLKAEISNTQESLNRSSELGRSMSDLSTFHAIPVSSKHKSSSDLSSTPQFNIDKERIKFLENRIRHLEKENQKIKTKSTTLNENFETAEEIKRLEAKIIDLNENLNEKECIIQARTKAITLMTENLSAKGKNTVDLLEDTKTEMFQMQKNFLETEDTYRTEISQLKAEIDISKNQIINLNEANSILETSRFELTMKNSKLENDVQNEITKNQKLNSVIKELNLKISEYENDSNAADREEEKFKKNIGEEYAEKLQALEDKIQEMQLENSQLKEFATNTSFNDIITDDQNSLEKIKSLEIFINEQNEKIQEYLKTTEEQEQTIIEKTTENKVLEAKMFVLEDKLKSKAPKPLFADTEVGEDDGEVNRLKQQLDESNKIMIKMKIKTKQLQKQIEGFKKTSNINAELVELTEKTQELSQRVIELEDEKGQLLLKLINNDEEKPDFEKTSNERNTEYNEKLTKLEDEVKNLNIKNVQLQSDKDDLQKKINHYIAENIDLLDKIEKFNKSSSSAESIEIVERLTQCEKREIEKYNLEASRNLKHSEKTDASMGQELSDSLIKLREESAELMHKVELFTLERKEVLEKMEVLSNENQDNLNKIETLQDEKNSLENKIEQLENDKKTLTTDLEGISERLPAPAIESLEKSEKSLQKLKIEIENYKKANDKNAKFNCSKKLAKEALNTYKQVDEYFKTIKDISKIESDSNLIPKESEEQLNNSSEYIIEIEKLQKNLVDLQNDNSSKDLEISKLRVEIETFVNAMSQINEGTKNQDENKFDQTEYSNQINNLQNDLRNLENEISSKSLEITSLKAELETVVLSKKSENVETDKLISEYLNKIDSLEQELFIKNENSSKDKELLRSKVASLEQETLIFQKLIAEQKEQLFSIISENEKEMELKSNELNKYQSQLESLKNSNTFEAEVEKLRKINEANLLEIENKQLTINELNDQIMELYKSMEEKVNELYAKDDEIALVEEKLVTTQNELEKLSKEYLENKHVTEKVLTELHSQKKHLPIEIENDSLALENENLKEKIKQVEKTNKELNIKNTEQMDKLKKFAANLKKKVLQCQQLEDKIKILENNSAISDSNERIRSLEIELNNVTKSFKSERDNLVSQLFSKSNELDSFISDYNECSVTIKQINLDLINYKQLLANILHTLKTKQNESFELRNRITEVENLKELMITENKAQLQKIEKCKTIIKEKNTEIKRLANEINNLQNIVVDETQSSSTDSKKLIVLQNDYTALKELHEKLLTSYNDEKNSFQATVSKLEILHNGVQAKLEENSAYIEILETENNSYKEKIYKLENCVATFEERRLSLEKRANILNDELQNKTTEFEKNEDALIYRLNMLSDHDEVIGSRLLAIEEQNEDLSRKLEDLKQDHSDLISKYSKVEKEYAKLKFENEDKEKSLVDENKDVKIKFENQKHEYEEKISKIQKDFEELENDYCIQLEKIQDEKKILTMSKEKLMDEISYYKDENMKLKETVNSLEQSKNDFERDITWIRMQNENLSQDQFELEELRLSSAQGMNRINELTQQLETVTNNFEFEIKQLQKKLHETPSNTNRTDDQVLIESENKRLKDLLTEKDNAIEMYQRQNLQLQMCNFSIPSNAGDIFPNEIESLRDRCNQYESTITQLRELCDNKDKHIEILQTELIQLNSLKSSNEANSAILDSTSSAWDNINIIDTDELIMPEIHKNKLQTGVFTTPIDTDYEKIQIAALQEKVLGLEKYITELENKLKIYSEQEPQKSTQQPELSNFFNMDMPSTFDTFSNMRTEVIEDAIVPKTAYLCYEDISGAQNAQQAHSISQQYSQTTDTQKLEDLINELKLEIKRSEEEKQILQIKSGKMMKKLKEYKSKIDQFEHRSSKSSSIELNDLDLAIQDEMKLQLKQLEQKISEQQIKLDREILEKEKLLKRIEVLTDANDRMIEIKEKKDIEHQILQNNITELNKKLKVLEDWSDEKPDNNSDDKTTVFSTTSNVIEIENLQLKIEDLQLDRDEIQQVLDEQYMKTKNLESEITKLKNNIIILENNSEQSSHDLVQQNSGLKLEITNLNETVVKLLNDLSILREENNNIIAENLILASENQIAGNECLQCINLKEQLEVLHKQCFDNNTVLEYRNMEIAELKQEIDKMEKQDQTSSLVQEILLKNQDILSLKNQVSDLLEQNVELENNLSLQIAKELNQNSENIKNQYQQEIDEKSVLIEKLLKEKQDMEFELKELNDFILKNPNHSKSLGTTDSKNPSADEFNYYKNMCNQLAAEAEDLKKLTQNVEKNSMIENSVDNELILWKQKCEQLTNELAHLNMINIDESNKSGGETSEEITIENMQKILETQELEIVTLKEQLAVRSAEFAKLAAQYDPYALQSSSSAFLSQKISTENDEVKQSKLNLYLYLIHQKDMRCEELTLELVSLLEERDTLQLHLSDSIRKIEEIKLKTGYADEDNKSNASSMKRASSSLDTSPEKKQLNEKLSQLHSIGYMKDKTIHENRGTQIETFEKDIANIPLEAVSEIVGQDLAKSSQSPSAALLSWLWGKPNTNPDNT